jgi:hypothetical protein
VERLLADDIVARFDMLAKAHENLTAEVHSAQPLCRSGSAAEPHRAALAAHRPGCARRIDAHWRKRFESWRQGVSAPSAKSSPRSTSIRFLVPQAVMIALPSTNADSLPFPPGHLLTKEDLTPVDLARKLEALLPRLDRAAAEAIAPPAALHAGADAASRREAPMTNNPVLVAYAVKDRPSGKPWSRIGVAFPHDNGAGLPVLLDALPTDGRIVLVEPKANPAAAVKDLPAPLPKPLRPSS